MAKLKLYRLEGTDFSWDDLTHAVVWAESPEDAVALLTDWHQNYSYKDDEPPTGQGDWSGPYTAIEVKPERKVVLTHVQYG